MLIFASLTVCKIILACNICMVESALNDEIVPTMCTNGTFYLHDYKVCAPCSQCDLYSTMFTPCTPTSDTVCIKCTDTSQPELAHHPACKQCPPCKSGEYVETPCTENTSTVCRPCPKGSFSYLGSYKSFCIPCASCENSVTITDCSASSNTLCGECKKGYFKDPNRNICNRCMSCVPGQLVIEECRNGLPGKLCSAYFFSRDEYIVVPARDPIYTSTPGQALTSTINRSTSDPTEVLANLTNSFTEIDLIVVITMMTLILTLLVMIALLRRRLHFQLKKFRKHVSDNSITVFYHKDNYGYIEEHADNESLTENRLSTVIDTATNFGISGLSITATSS